MYYLQLFAILALQLECNNSHRQVLLKEHLGENNVSIIIFNSINQFNHFMLLEVSLCEIEFNFKVFNLSLDNSTFYCTWFILISFKKHEKTETC